MPFSARGCDGFRTHAEVFETGSFRVSPVSVASIVPRPDLASTWGRRSSLWDVESAQQQATVDLLSVLAWRTQAFQRLSQDACFSPDLAGREAVTEMAIGEYGHYKILVEGLRARAKDPMQAMRPFMTAIDNFHKSTSPADYPEALVKIYVGTGSPRISTAGRHVPRG